MTDTTGLLIQGDDGKNKLYVKIVEYDNGDRDVYNVIHAAGGNDYLSAYDENYTTLLTKTGAQLFGEEGNDVIVGSYGDDTLSGGDGNDVIHWTPGHDIIEGGDGADTLAVGSHAPAVLKDDLVVSGVERLILYGHVVIEDFDLGQFDKITKLIGRVWLTFSEQADLSNVDFEGRTGWQVTGSGFDDKFDFSASGAGLTVYGKDGDDRIIGGQGSNALDGGNGNDVVIGGSKSDGITGGAGDDLIRAGAGDDGIVESDGTNEIHAGDGNDLIRIHSGTNLIFSDSGDDRIELSGSGGAQTISAGDGNDTIVSSISDDMKIFIHGGAGKDLLYATKHISSLYCEGVEELNVQTAPHEIVIPENTLNSFETIDYIWGHKIVFSEGGHFSWRDSNGKGIAVPTQIFGSDEQDDIDLSKSNSLWTVKGGSGDDSIVGGKFINYLYGGDGDDILDGGKGQGVAYGGTGRDTFQMSSGDQSLEVRDFQASGANHDVVDISAFGSVTSFEQLMNSHVYHFGSALIVFGDTSLQLDHVSWKSLTASDFIF